ncbi:SDR family NAD(P)-dependent oxidoreductase [Saccharopolyspora sp. MS10]|uniref:SDR family NAD(P)-dependent oxidoreductase n=1 Tax=Saccharopolyspora sp. MS10 TaxID=3385973 RepID=UPI0039A2FA69
MELHDRRIIVTGGARGIGAAAVRGYTAAGANVISMSLNQELGAEVAAAATAEGPGKAAFLRVDVSDPEQVAAGFDEAASRLGGLDVLAHAAAIQRSGDAGGVTVGDWDAMFAVNVRGTMLTNQAAHRHMAPSGGGSIINFGSISGLRAEPGAPAYSASKGAVHSWTRTAAAAWGGDGVRVNAVLPAMVTPMYEAARARLDEAGRTADYWANKSTIALGHEYGDPDRDLGPVLVFLASDGSRFITGQLLPVDGGQAAVR